jgi:methylated-DNA-[protein]-cysteine S-methyltransferase
MPRHAVIRTTIPGPWGPFHLAATERGVVAVAWLTTEAAFDADLATRLHAGVEDARDVGPRDPRRIHLDGGLAALEDLLAGRPPRRTVAFDLADRSSWDQRVLEAVATIPWGRTASYAEIARQVGVPRAARAVGGAVGRNPVSLLIPCHRVIAADGTLGGYGGDGWGGREERLAIKRELLRREGVDADVRSPV